MERRRIIQGGKKNGEKKHLSGNVPPPRHSLPKRENWIHVTAARYTKREARLMATFARESLAVLTRTEEVFLHWKSCLDIDLVHSVFSASPGTIHLTHRGRELQRFKSYRLNSIWRCRFLVSGNPNSRITNSANPRGGTSLHERRNGLNFKWSWNVGVTCWRRFTFFAGQWESGSATITRINVSTPPMSENIIQGFFDKMLERILSAPLKVPEGSRHQSISRVRLLHLNRSIWGDSFCSPSRSWFDLSRTGNTYETDRYGMILRSSELQGNDVL